jgi:AcrR family transcriptional regulator
MQKARTPEAIATDAERRAELADAAIWVFRARDFHTIGFADVADATGATEQELRRLFPIWELLLVAVADRWSGTRRRMLAPVAETEGTVAYLRALLEAAESDRGYIRMRFALLSAASAPDHAASGWFRRSYAAMYEDVTLALAKDVIAKREPKTMLPRHAAEQLLALYEGLQLQSMLRDDTDLLPAFDRAVTRMRAGWKVAYSA